jgi:hypothetical protein
LSGAEPLEPLFPHPFRGQLSQPAGLGLDRLPGGGVDLELEPGREPERPEDPEVVLAEPLRRIADRPDQPPVQVAGSVERVTPLVPQRVVGDRVDGEVAPGQVVVQRGTEFHDRMAAVRRHIAPEGGDLVVASAGAHRHGAEPLADRHGVAEQPLDHVGGGRGRHVVVGVGLAQQRVPDRATHTPRLVTRRFQLAGDLENVGGDVEARGEGHQAGRCIVRRSL